MSCLDVQGHLMPVSLQDIPSSSHLVAFKGMRCVRFVRWNTSFSTFSFFLVKDNNHSHVSLAGHFGSDITALWATQLIELQLISCSDKKRRRKRCLAMAAWSAKLLKHLNWCFNSHFSSYFCQSNKPNIEIQVSFIVNNLIPALQTGCVT